MNSQKSCTALGCFWSFIVKWGAWNKEPSSPEEFRTCRTRSKGENTWRKGRVYKTKENDFSLLKIELIKEEITQANIKEWKNIYNNIRWRYLLKELYFQTQVVVYSGRMGRIMERSRFRLMKYRAGQVLHSHLSRWQHRYRKLVLFPCDIRSDDYILLSLWLTTAARALLAASLVHYGLADFRWDAAVEIAIHL